MAKDVDRIIKLIEQITNALTKTDFLSSQEQQQLKRYTSYENWRKLETAISKIDARPFNKDENKRRRTVINYDPNLSQTLKKKLLKAKEKHINSTIKPLQKNLDPYLTPRWSEILALSTQGHKLKQEIERFVSYQFDCQTIQRFLPAVPGIPHFDDTLLANEKKVIHKLQRIKAKLEYNQKQFPDTTETEQNATPAKRWRIRACIKRIPRWIYVVTLFFAALLTCIYLLWWLWTKFST